jgi:flagellar basal-body rod protein FlgC
MAAQTVRLNTIASNLANADSVAGTEGDTYRARKPVFAAVMDGPGGMRRRRQGQVLDVVQSDEPLRRVYEPGPDGQRRGHGVLPQCQPGGRDDRHDVGLARV